MFEGIFDYVDKDTYMLYMRLFCVLSFYLVARKWYTNWARQRQIKTQMEADEKEKSEKEERDKKAAQELEERLEAEANTFGWGKKTRKNVKLQEAILSSQVADLRERHQTSFNEAEDHDIEDLLED